MEELKKDVESVKQLSANKSFLENVNDLSILKTRPVNRQHQHAGHAQPTAPQPHQHPHPHPPTLTYSQHQSLPFSTTSTSTSAPASTTTDVHSNRTTVFEEFSNCAAAARTLSPVYETVAANRSTNSNNSGLIKAAAEETASALASSVQIIQSSRG